MKTNFEFRFKILVIGNSSAGKSAIVQRFTQNNFTGSFMPTMGVDINQKTVTIDGINILNKVWDAAGQEKFKNITNQYYKGVQGIMIVYDVTDKQSFTDVGNWLANVKKLANENVALILIGNKSDQTDYRQVAYDEAKQLADSMNIKFIETSAKESLNIETAFITLSQEINVKIKESVKNNEETPLQQEK